MDVLSINTFPFLVAVTVFGIIALAIVVLIQKLINMKKDGKLMTIFFTVWIVIQLLALVGFAYSAFFYFKMAF